MSKTCFRCQRPVPPGPIAFVPGPPGEGGWACPPRSRDACNLEAALRRHVEQLMAAEAAHREAEVRAVLVFVSLATGVPVARIVADRIAELTAVERVHGVLLSHPGDPEPDEDGWVEKEATLAWKLLVAVAALDDAAFDRVFPWGGDWPLDLGELALLLAREGDRTAVLFDRYGVVTADLAVNDDAWEALTGNEPGRRARATFDIGAVTWSTEPDRDVAVASRARLIAVYLAPVPAVPPGEIDREQLWPSDTLFTKVDR